MAPKQVPVALSRPITLALTVILLATLSVPAFGQSLIFGGLGTASGNGFSPITYGSGLLGDFYDAGNLRLDPTKQSGLNGRNTNWDIIGNDNYALLQVAFTSTEVYFRVRLADYKPIDQIDGSVIVLLNKGSETIGVGALLSSRSPTLTGVYSVTPKAGTSLTANFQYETPTFLSDSSNVDYATVASIDGTDSGISDGDDAFLTFRVLKSNLTDSNGAFFMTNGVGFTAFTNTTTNWNGNINGDYIGSLGAVPEPSTWASTAALLTSVGLIWWRRRKAKTAA